MSHDAVVKLAKLPAGSQIELPSYRRARDPEWQMHTLAPTPVYTHIVDLAIKSWSLLWYGTHTC